MTPQRPDRRDDHDQVGRLPCLLLGLLLPRSRRDEFIGDLVEEAKLRAARQGDLEARRWLWRQVWRSCPSLVVARLRRLPSSAAVAVAMPSAAGAGMGGAFGGLVVRGQKRGGRSLPLTVSVLVHVLVLTALVVRGMWGVDEVIAPSVLITFWQALPVPAPPLFEPPGGGKRHEVVRPEQRVQKTPVRPRPPTALPVAIVPAMDKPGDGPTDGPGTRPGHGTGDQDCPEGSSDCIGNGDPPPIVVLPPRVGEKSCLSCALPQLPPAYMRFGTVQNILMRICVDADGHVSSTKILSGIGGAADDGVAATVARWRFAPYAVQGRPVPFCYVSRFVFTPG
jgi:hypothetical protein